LFIWAVKSLAARRFEFPVRVLDWSSFDALTQIRVTVGCGSISSTTSMRPQIQGKIRCHGEPLFDAMTVKRSTRDGVARRNVMSRSLLDQTFADGGRVAAPHLQSIIRHLDGYV
jgi:hypothetical protein